MARDLKGALHEQMEEPERQRQRVGSALWVATQENRPQCANGGLEAGQGDDSSGVAIEVAQALSLQEQEERSRTVTPLPAPRGNARA